MSATTIINDETHAKLLECLCSRPVDLMEVAKRCGLTMPQLAAWAAKPQTQAELAALRMLMDFSIQFEVSRQRHDALLQLYHIAMDDKNLDRARRACVDILKVHVVAQPRQTSKKEASAAPAPASEAAAAPAPEAAIASPPEAAASAKVERPKAASHNGKHHVAASMQSARAGGGEWPRMNAEGRG